MYAEDSMRLGQCLMEYQKESKKQKDEGEAKFLVSGSLLQLRKDFRLDLC